jgi:hypothetical protein
VGGRRKSCRGERKARRRRESRDGSLVVSWGLCWLPVVELVVEKLVMAPIGGWNGGKREGEKKL